MIGHCVIGLKVIGSLAQGPLGPWRAYGPKDWVIRSRILSRPKGHWDTRLVVISIIGASAQVGLGQGPLGRWIIGSRAQTSLTQGIVGSLGRWTLTHDSWTGSLGRWPKGHQVKAQGPLVQGSWFGPRAIGLAQGVAGTLSHRSLGHWRKGHWPKGHWVTQRFFLGPIQV